MIRCSNATDIHLPQSVFFAVSVAAASEAKQHEVAYMAELNTPETNRQRQFIALFFFFLLRMCLRM